MNGTMEARVRQVEDRLIAKGSIEDTAMVDKDLSDLLVGINGIEQLSGESMCRLRSIAAEMRHREMPAEVIRSGLRSTAVLLLEQERDARSRVQATEVRRFVERNAGKVIKRSDRETPRREAKAVAREELLERVSSMIRTARSTRRKHEVLSLRRDLLELDQARIRRLLGVEGAALCDEINEWLNGVKGDLNGGTF